MKKAFFIFIIIVVSLITGGGVYYFITLPQHAEEQSYEGEKQEQESIPYVPEEKEVDVVSNVIDELTDTESVGFEDAKDDDMDTFLIDEYPKETEELMEPEELEKVLLPQVNETTAGRITEDEIWRGEIRIIGDIEVIKGVTLTIEPGSKILIAANQDSGNLNLFPLFNLEKGINNTKDFDQYIHRGEPYRDEANHISINIKGTLQAIGAPDNMITITSDSAAPNRYDWNVFSFADGTLSYVVMEYYRALNPGNGTKVLNNTLRHVGECAVCANSNVLVENNTITDAGHELIDMHNSSPTIRNNQLGPNPNKAGIVIDGGSPSIIGNNIFDTGDGILFISKPKNPVLESNTFSNNEEDIAHNY